MAEFAEVIETKKRMCKALECTECGMDFSHNKRKLLCSDLTIKFPKEAEEIIMEWGKEHPIKRNIDVLKEIFGKTFLFGDCDGLECPNVKECKDCDYHEFWEREYKEQK